MSISFGGINMKKRWYLKKAIAILLCTVMILSVSGMLQTGNAAASWTKVGNILVTAKGVCNVNIVSDKGVVYASYILNNKTYIKKLSGSKWVTVSSISAKLNNLKVSNNVLYFSDYCYNESKALYIYKYSNSKWTKLPAVLPANRYCFGYDIAIYNGMPYVVYSKYWGYDNDGSQCDGIYVSKYNGSKWVPVGSLIGKFVIDCDSPFVDLSLLFSSGTPYLSTSCAGVKKFNGKSWVTVGNSGPNQGGGHLVKTSSAFYSADIFSEWDGEGHVNSSISVYKNVGSKWVLQGGNIYTDVYDIIGIMASDKYVYIYYPSGTKLYLKRLDGSKWVNVCPGISLNVYTMNIVNGIPYMVYLDTSNNMIVKQYK